MDSWISKMRSEFKSYTKLCIPLKVPMYVNLYDKYFEAYISREHNKKEKVILFLYEFGKYQKFMPPSVWNMVMSYYVN